MSANPTWNRALVERYEAAFPHGPALWGGIKKEGTTRVEGIPNVVLHDLGQKPVYEQGDDGRLTIAGFDARVKFTVYGNGDQQADDIGQQVMDAMESGPLTVGLDTDVRLMLDDYRVNPTIQRGPTGQFIFMASITYKASFNKTGGGPR
jgi:hypothetical protein